MAAAAAAAEAPPTSPTEGDQMIRIDATAAPKSTPANGGTHTVQRQNTADENPKEGELARKVYINEPEKNMARNVKMRLAKDNTVRTSKYTFWNLSFIAVNLSEQLNPKNRFANVYFLFIIILSSIPVISAIPPFTTAFPLFLVLLATLIKDSHDDLGRHRSDKQVNDREVDRLVATPGGPPKWAKCRWNEVVVGDILRVNKDEAVPADLLLLSTSTPELEARVETAELDGETNLKRQYACATSAHAVTPEKLHALRGQFVCEPPNTDLKKLSGTYYLGDDKEPVSMSNILLRGVSLRNTDWAVGMAVYVGRETRLMQNSKKSKRKTTSLDKAMNDIVFTIVFVLLVLCSICAIINSVWQKELGRDFNFAYNYYSYDTGNNTGYADLGNLRNDDRNYVAFLSFWLYFILLSQLVPISLYVSVEFIRLGQSVLINWDGTMYSEEFNTPAQSRSTALTDQLGQIDYIFSDKTGTLTQNVMDFHSCHIGESYEPDDGSNICAKLKLAVGQKPEVDLFFRLLALCHTVEVEIDGDKRTYAASSPDEKALCEGAQAYGVEYLTDVNQEMKISFQGKEETYVRLHTLEFNSTLKRMSIIVKDAVGAIHIFSKGADSNMAPLLSKETRDHNDAWKVLNQSLDHYSEVGLRTLVLGHRVIPQAEYDDWAARYHEAETATEDRDELTLQVRTAIEQELNLVGATAIEDKLQDGVPETIKKIKDAEIKLWVLTGDKQQTAINIGYSCNLLNRSTMLSPFIIDVLPGIENPFDAVRSSLEQQTRLHAESITRRTATGELYKYGLVVGGQCLKYILRLTPRDLPEMAAELGMPRGKETYNKLKQKQRANAKIFLKLAGQCTSVICCRVTPLQKSEVVKLVSSPVSKDGPWLKGEPHEPHIALAPRTLAIGDGANDVSMINEAHVGVGISGLEGRQAVLASDYSFAQFRFLQQLLLVHGRWSYMRMCIFMRYFFYKSAAFSLAHFLYAFYCGGSGLTIYDPLYTSMYNVVFTSLPIMVVGIFEQDVNAATSLEFPILYGAGIHNVLFNYYSFVHSMVRGLYHSLLLFFMLYIAMLGGGAIDSNGEIQSDYYTFGMQLSAALTIVVNLTLALEVRYWTWIVVVFMVVGPIGYLILTGVEYQSANAFGNQLEFIAPYYDTFYRCFGGSMFWQYFSLVLAMTILPELLIQLFQEYVLHTPIDLVREHVMLIRPNTMRSRINRASVHQAKEYRAAKETRDLEEARSHKEEYERRKSFRAAGILEPAAAAAAAPATDVHQDAMPAAAGPLSPPTQVTYISSVDQSSNQNLPPQVHPAGGLAENVQGPIAPPVHITHI